MTRRSWLVLFAILVLAAGLRTWNLNQIPPGLYMDEASVGVEAHALLTTGSDSRGTRAPVLFRALDDWKHPLYIYATAVSEAVLGPTKTAVRLPGAVFGTLTVLLLALLAFELFADAKAALLAAFFLAVMPWHVHYSRAWEAITLDFTAVLALWLFYRARRLGGASRFALAGAAFGLMLYSYVAVKLLLPALLVAIAIIERKESREIHAIRDRVWKHAENLPAPPVNVGPVELPLPRIPVGASDVRTLLVALLLIAAPMIAAQIAHWDEIQTRFRAVSVFREKQPFLAMGRSYLAHLDPGFVFVRGDSNPRHSIPGWGLALVATAPLVALGLLRAVARRTPENLVLLAWLAIYPLGAVLTSEGIPHATRSFLGAPLYALLAASGAMLAIDRVLGARAKAILAALVVLATLGNAALVFQDYFTVYARQTSSAWGAGVEELIPELLAHRKRFRRVHFLPAPQGGVGLLREHVLFLTRFDPELDPLAKDAFFRWDDPVSWPRFLKALPNDEALVIWGDQPTGQIPYLVVHDAEGNVAFQVHVGMARK